MLFAIMFGLLAFSIPSATGFAVTGTQGGVDNTTGFRPMRIEINQFKYAGAAWDLYILSLQRFYTTSQTEQFSYYQVAGIHGYPNVPWDGVTGAGGGVGYCAHGSILFPVWHRPYLALFENILWNNAQQIAAQYPAPQRDMYQAAAVTMRIPYWDWSTEYMLPDVTTNEKISVNTPEGFQTIDNPLFNYTFHPLVPSDLPDLPRYPTSVRYPDPTTNQSQNQLANTALFAARDYWHDYTYLLFSSEPNYQAFSNVYGGAENNLETIHGGIHNYVGGPSPNLGHMTLLWYSAMDPIFWLHHANVDRVTAIWQAIYPNSYVVTQESQLESSYYTALGTNETATYPLAPFHYDNYGNMHTALTVQYLKPFGYTYPELQDWNTTSQAEYSQSVIAIVNEIYHPGWQNDSSNFSFPSLRRRSRQDQPIGAALAADWEWALSLNVNRSALPEPLVLYFFNSPPPNLNTTDPTTWAQLPSLLGSQLVLQPHPGLAVSSSTVAKGLGAVAFTPPRTSIPLTPALLTLSSLDPSVVLPWLSSNLFFAAVPAPSPEDSGDDGDGGPMERRTTAVVEREWDCADDDEIGPSDGCVIPEFEEQGEEIAEEEEEGGGAEEVDLLGGAVTVQVKARSVTQNQRKGSFPVYGAWTVFGNGTLAGSAGAVGLSLSSK